MKAIAGELDEARLMIVAAARTWIGTPYMHQASLVQVGCDCLGLIRGVWREVIGPEPEAAGAYSPDWAEANSNERLLDAGRRHFIEMNTHSWQAGDVLLFRWRVNAPAKHLGIATSRSSMIHAHDGAAVCEVSINPFWARRLVHAFAYPVARN